MALYVDKKVEFGKRLKEAREKCNITQKEMAERIGCWQSQFVYWENGTRKPSKTYIEKIAKELKIDPIELLFGNGEVFYKKTKYGKEITIRHINNHKETKLSSNYKLLSNDEKHIVNELIDMLVEEKRK